MRKNIIELKEQLAKIVGFLAKKVDNKDSPLVNDQSQNQDQNEDVPPPKTLKFPIGFTPPNYNLPPPSHPFGGNPPSFGPQSFPYPPQDSDIHIPIHLITSLEDPKAN